jgi:hypothetical protein
VSSGQQPRGGENAPARAFPDVDRFGDPATGRAGMQPAPVEPLRVRESKAVTVKDAKFVVLAESDWKLGKADKAVPIEIQLRINNVGKTDVLFQTFTTFGMSLVRPNGKKVMPTGGADHTIFTRPVIIAEGASYSLCRRAELRWNAETKASELTYWDGTGMVTTFGSLEPGRYKLSFWYATYANKRAPQESKASDAVTWLGEAVTDEVVIEVHGR